MGLQIEVGFNLLAALIAICIPAVNILMELDCRKRAQFVALGLLTGDEGAVEYFLDLWIFRAGNKLDAVAFAIGTVVLSLAPFLDTGLAKDRRATANAIDWLIGLRH